MTPIYFDHNATTRPLPEVVDAVVSTMQDDFGNPSSLHWAGQDAVRTLDTARTQVSKLLDCRADEITFTSGATEANTMVLRGVIEQHLRSGTKLADLHVVTSAIEHSSVLRTLEDMELQGLRVTYVAAGWDGRVNARQVEAAIEKDTVLVSIMLANNDTGVLQPLEDIARFAHGKQVLVHSDITQAVGKVLVHPKTMGIDFASLSAHKFQGPRGVGALWMRNGIKLLPLLRGGKQELSMRAGTENVPAIAGMGVACIAAQKNLQNYAQHCEMLRTKLQTGLLQLFPDLRIYGELAPRVPNTLCIGLPGVDGMSLMLNLDLEGIAMSVGSACGAGDHEPSHVLRGMGCTELEALSTVRFSLGTSNTLAEINCTIQAMEHIVPRLRTFAPTSGVCHV